MTRLVAFIALLSCFVLGTSGSKTVRDVHPYPMSESSLLWKISGKNVKKDCYLFGTIHLIERKHFYFPESLRELIGSSEQVVTELGELPDPAEAMKFVFLKEGSFFDFFNEAQTDSILDWAEANMGMSREQFRLTMGQMKPFMVVQMATQMQYSGNTASYELSIDSLVKAREISLFGLETLEQQMGFFDGLTNLQQTAMVMEVIRDDQANTELTQRMQQIYLRQQVDSLYMLIHNEKGILSEEEDRFLGQRNANWIPRIGQLIRKKSTFIAVGAGHLGGPNGLIRLLEREGYTLTPVKL